ncbi:MAG: hypothetical protein CO094_02000 [Anaerolineae bacterium CG_4_9_14_3_um_filter_57_17]|nr:DUF4173 domain-containing protein [bacterium]NCT21474.1 DUF4173 domain-containing protein [bacterium]OIO86575.1 MAG: hypothetical protein AUK01_02675 [Anaerolineae bacterium CG2_30_57_67]PJB68208.1 MAG: hypothetical protein CO094_02000 [Anaerolineae bacterium CG_4_9_14_3_um_filter_57_17]
MRKQSILLWMSALALGWAADFLFWKHTPGISFAIYAALTLGVGLFLLLRAGLNPGRGTYPLLVLIFFFAVFTFVRAEALSVFLAHALTLFLMAVCALTYQGGRWGEYSLSDYVVRFFGLLGSGLAGPLGFISEVNKLKRESGADMEQHPSRIWPIVRGLLLAVPVLAFFAALLSSADAVFSAQVETIVRLLRLENLPEYIFRAIYISIIAYVLVGVYLHAASHSADEKLLGVEKAPVSPFLGFTEAAIVLGAVSLLFGGFVFIQFQYFFGGLTNIRLEGFTYADYARRGFGELVTVAFFSLLLLLGLSAITRRESDQQRQIFSWLGILIVALVGVMLVSAYQRLVLYEIAYGFTNLRIYTHVFIVWLALLLIATVSLDLTRQLRRFALAALLAFIGFTASLLLMNVDGFIVRQNVTHNITGAEVDVAYLASLSSDAIPALAELYISEKVDAATRDKLGAALACAQHTDKNLTSDTSWQAFRLSRFWAEKALAALDLKEYSLDDVNYQASVVTPLGKTYDCQTFIFD